MSIAENLKALRKRRGWGQAELARRAGVTQPTISMIESRRQGGAQATTLIKLAEALGVEVGDFFAEDVPPVPPPPKTPLTDETSERFDKRFAAAKDFASAEALRDEVGAEFDALREHIKHLKAAGVEGADFPLRLARARLEKATHRTYAITTRAEDLARNRQTHDTVAEYAPRIAEAEAFWATVVEGEARKTRRDAG
jgi:transcriptional regulator with XRE-family HTH domain